MTFLFVEAVSSTATGASLTQVTVTVPVATLDHAGQKLSVNWNTNASVPQKFAFGV